MSAVTSPLRRSLRLVGAGSVALALVATGTAAANAKGGDATIKTGACSISSDWKLKAKPDNGALEVEFEVDSNVVGQTWTVTLKDNGTKFFAGTATTVGPSGSFSIAQRPANLAGADKIVAVAKNAATGETCRGSVTV